MGERTARRRLRLASERTGRVAGAAIGDPPTPTVTKGNAMTIVEPTTDTKVEAGESAEAAESPEGTPQVEVLVEEISIDGMCGVY